MAEKTLGAAPKEALSPFSHSTLGHVWPHKGRRGPGWTWGLVDIQVVSARADLIHSCAQQHSLVLDYSPDLKSATCGAQEDAKGHLMVHNVEGGRWNRPG